jgi:hypothetical protein
MPHALLEMQQSTVDPTWTKQRASIMVWFGLRLLEIDLGLIWVKVDNHSYTMTRCDAIWLA